MIAFSACSSICHLDRQPISGRLRSERGADERFVGWLGFVEALKRVHDLEGTGANMSERTSSPMPTLVAGGTGQDRSQSGGAPDGRAACPFAMGSRSGEPPFDWEDRSTWAPGAEKGSCRPTSPIILTRFPAPRRRWAPFAELAVKSGVPRLVLMSGRGEEEVERAEQAVRDSGAELTVLHSTWFTPSGLRLEHRPDAGIDGGLWLPCLGARLTRTHRASGMTPNLPAHAPATRYARAEPSDAGAAGRAGGIRATYTLAWRRVAAWAVGLADHQRLDGGPRTAAPVAVDRSVRLPSLRWNAASFIITIMPATMWLAA